MLIGTLRLSNVVPPPVAQKIHRYASANEYGNVTIHDLEKSNWREILAMLKAADLAEMTSSPMVHETFDYDCRKVTSDWVGAVIGPDYVANSDNPATDLKPPLPKPCRGIVKPGIPLQVRGRPQGHVACIDDEVILSDALCRLLKDQLIVTGEVVTSTGDPLRWNRIQPKAIDAFLSTISFYAPIHCALCQTRYVPLSGLWIAREDELAFEEMCMDELGYSHLESRQPLVLSIDCAQRITAILKKGFAIAPVYAISSPKAQLAREFLLMVDELFEGIGIE
jgi:hypothetical protein